MRLAFLILLVCVTVLTLSCRKAPAEPQAETAPGKAVPSAAPGIAGAADPKPPSVVTAPEEVHSVVPVIAANMTPEFLNAFQDSKECRGLQLSTNGEKTRRDFMTLTSFALADTPEMEPQWLWTLFDTRGDAKGQFRAAGNADSAPDAMRDLCVQVWESLNTRFENHK